ncbi:hypothetical protein ACSXBP_11270 [Clostridium perfringens]|uniref:hypothetical protein n=1 Tax=Clostridium perfringens TaxID=1502 RepID=UPI001899C5F7|nr:hypothetical protein [Clostridium perfringens]HAT4093265.1 hypothetical protein [Clostridium perfringens]
MVNFNDYEEFIDPVLCENPVMFLEKIRNGNDELPLDNTDIIKYSTLIRKLWEPHKRENIQINLTVEKKAVEHSENDVIFDYNFINLIRDIKQNGKAKSANIIINENGYICDIIQLNDNITVNYSIIKSKEKNTICFFLSYKGIDILINGILFDSDNHINSYKDVASNKFLSIFDYKKLLGNFYIEEIKYDPDKYFFAYSNQIPKEHKHLLDKHNKLLFAAPEERFQNRLVRYLKNNCEESVQEEVRNADNDRYDVWILSEDKKLFVIEIKWLGQSINVEGKISSTYGSKRFLDGAYQLKEYIDNSDTYSDLFKDIKIYQGILLTYDARENDTSIPCFPEELQKHSNLDLTSQHYILEKDKIKASNIYKQKIKA